MSLFSDGLSFAANRLEDSAGECVTYVRDGESDLEITAVPAESRLESVQPDGTIVEFRTRDFIIRKCLIDFGSGSVAPERKDKILWEEDGEVKTFEVLPEPGLQHFRDSGRYSYRIYTKEKPS